MIGKAYLSLFLKDSWCEYPSNRLDSGLGPIQEVSFQVVIPAKAGIQWALVMTGRWIRRLDSRLRGNDEIMGLRLTEPHWALTGYLPDAALGLLDGKTPASWLLGDVCCCATNRRSSLDF